MFAAVLAALAVASARAARSDSAALGTGYGPLDGMQFEGGLGPAGKPLDRQDVIYFGDGQFWSKNCVPCGFQPGAYWVRFAGDEIHFRGELRSAERGRFSYTGVIRGGKLIAQINWRRQRWYWSIDRDFRFEGTITEQSAGMSAATAAGVALTADAQPGECRLQ